jgi:hypothetical protein
MPLEGEFGNLCHHSIGRMAGDRNLLSLHASLAIPTCVLRFEDSGLCRRTPVRPVLLTGQTGQTHRSDPPVRPTGQTGLELLQLRLRFFGLGFVDQPRNPIVF